MTLPSKGDVWEAMQDRPFGLRRKLALTAEVVALYARARWLLARCDVATVVATLRGDAQDHVNAHAAEVFGRRVGSALKRALDPLPFDSRCLMSSLVLTAMMGRRGVRCTLVIGVRHSPSFQAHAWVEHGGRALLSPLGYDVGRLVEL